ncbi:MAG: polysaccharide biosynthesis C-terminal domain-containing protein [Pyrinomonadaceae bacterium]
MTPDPDTLPAAQVDTMDPAERRSSGWDIRNAPRNYISLVVYQAGSAFFSFAAVWIITKYLGSAGYGGVVATIAASQVAQIFVNWTALSVARFGVEEFVNTGRISNSFWARTIILLPNTIVFLLFSFLWLPLLSEWLTLPPEAGFYVGLHFVVSAMWLHVQYAIQGAKLPRLHGLLIAAERGVIFLILVILVWADHLGFYTALIAYIGSPLLMTVIGSISLRGLVSWRFAIGRDWLWRIIKFSIPLIPYSFIGYFSSMYLDSIFIVGYLGKAELGVYSLAYQTAGILMQLPLLAGSLLLPFFVTLRTSNKETQISSYMQDVMPVLCLLWAVGCVFAALVLSLLIPLAFGVEMSAASRLVLLLTACTAINGPVLFGYGAFINAYSATYISTILTTVLGLTNLVFNIVLIPKYGLTGAAFASIVAYFASVLVTAMVISYRFNIKRDWAIESTIPGIMGLVVFWLTESFFAGILFAGALAVVITLINRSSVRRGISLLAAIRTRNS